MRSRSPNACSAPTIPVPHHCSPTTRTHVLADRDGTIAMSDGLARWTRDESLPLKIARSFGMIALDRIAPLQSLLIDRGMGFRGEIPSLAARSVP